MSDAPENFRLVPEAEIRFRPPYLSLSLRYPVFTVDSPCPDPGLLGPDHRVTDMERFLTALMQALHDAHTLGWKNRGDVERPGWLNKQRSHRPQPSLGLSRP